MPLNAQPDWTKRATKSVFTLKTFGADGTMIASTNGFYTGANGEAVSNFTPFKGATRAVIIDAQGKEYQVTAILGANDMYDVVKFRVNNPKSQPLSVSSAIAPVGSTVWLLPYREVKGLNGGPVRKAETIFGEYGYYTVAVPMTENQVSCPLMNDAGEVVGMMQQPATARDTLNYAIDARFVDSLKITGLTYNDATLQMTQIRKELPSDLKEANLVLYLSASQMDSTAYATLIEDFIRQFPDVPDGYTARAMQEAGGADFAAAERDMQQALRCSSNKDDAHFTFARMIYNKVIYQSDKSYEAWTLDKALAEIQAASAINPLPTYRQLEANILFSQKKYDEACQVFTSLTGTDLRSAEVFFGAAKCKEMLRDTTAALALMDSTLATFSRPYLKEAAPYLWARAEMRRDAGRYRDAVADMNDYEALMAANVNNNFYYVRHQTEIQGHLYQQALNDIGRAIQMNPQETLYYAEKASLEVRVGLYDEAIATASECIAIDAANSDGYLFLGLAQCLKGDKAEGIANLQKAKELGDPQAEALIGKYQ
ncbi:MAG: serine protease [Prevotella sp.]|nr:serine protease [Prevotella sp.]